MSKIITTNMKGDNQVIRRGHHPQRRGKKADPHSDNRGGTFYHDALQTKDSITDIEFPYPRRGKWTYPKPGFIQWRNDAENIPNKVRDTKWESTMSRLIDKWTRDEK